MHSLKVTKMMTMSHLCRAEELVHEDEEEVSYQEDKTKDPHG